MANASDSFVRPRNAYLAPNHLKELEEFATSLEQSVKAALPSPGNPFEKVAVLAFHWANDDLNVEPLENQLLQTFQETYKFDVESYVIPLEDSFKSLQFKFLQFIQKWESVNSLMIFVYSGHSQSANIDSGFWYIAGTTNKKTGNLIGPKIEWFTVSSALPYTKGKVLVIMDCCFAASAATFKSEMDIPHGPELLAASAWENVASSNNQTCFTRLLIDELHQTHGEPVSIAQLYSSLVRKALSSKIRACPVYVPKLDCESIILAKLEDKARPNQQFEPRRTRSMPKPKPYRVLISVHLESSVGVLDLEQWKKWLLSNIPSDILSSQIAIQAVFDSTSSLVLVSVPIEVWSMLPANKQLYRFVGFVTSDNLLPGLEDTLGALVERPKGTENDKPSSGSGGGMFK